MGGTLDLDFGRKLLGDEKASENDVLRLLISRLSAETNQEKNAEAATFLDDLRSTITQAMFFALLDKDPMVGLKWSKSNRLSMLSIPGSKTNSVEDLELIIEKGTTKGLPSEELEKLKKIVEKLEPL